MTPCKDGSKRKGKVTATAKRIHFRTLAWEPVRAALLKHLQNSPIGEASRIARLLGTSQSQVHRWTCPICEHDTEPNFSQGYALSPPHTQEISYTRSHLPEKSPRILSLSLTPNINQPTSEMVWAFCCPDPILATLQFSALNSVLHMNT